MDRKQKIRPELPGISDVSKKSSTEAFQNTVLRPIIKMQHDIVVIHFKNASRVKNAKIEALNTDERNALIQGLFSHDHRFKAEIKGMVLGAMTLDEYTIYLEDASEYNKRIFKMIAQRVDSVFK